MKNGDPYADLNLDPNLGQVLDLDPNPNADSGHDLKSGRLPAWYYESKQYRIKLII